jgi:mono/diheme cytochrome c family protein
MKKKSFKAFAVGALYIVPMMLLSCQENLGPLETNSIPETEAALTLKSTAIDLPGRVLASNCFQCHGTNGYAGELPAIGSSPQYFRGPAAS